jgi:hypothetical protein
MRIELSISPHFLCVNLIKLFGLFNWSLGFLLLRDTEGKSLLLGFGLLLWLYSGFSKTELFHFNLELLLLFVEVWNPWHDDVENVLMFLQFARLQDRIVQHRFRV